MPIWVAKLLRSVGLIAAETLAGVIKDKLAKKDEATKP